MWHSARRTIKRIVSNGAILLISACLWNFVANHQEQDSRGRQQCSSRLRSCHVSLGRRSQNELATELPNVRFSKNFACWHQQVGFAKFGPSITDIPYRINALLSWEDWLSEMVRPTRPPILSPGQTKTSRVNELTGDGINCLTH